MDSVRVRGLPRRLKAAPGECQAGPGFSAVGVGAPPVTVSLNRDWKSPRADTVAVMLRLSRAAGLGGPPKIASDDPQAARGRPPHGAGEPPHC